MSAGACTALITTRSTIENGHRTRVQLPAPEPCGKTVGTMPTDQGPRCFVHDPTARAERRQARRQAKRLRPPIKDPKTPAEIKQLLTWAINKAASGEMTPAHANAVSSMAKTLRLVANDRTAEAINWAYDALEAVQGLFDMLPPNPRVLAVLERVQHAFARLEPLHEKETSSDEP